MRDQCFRVFSNLSRLPVAKAHCIISGLAKGANPFERSCASRRFSSTPFRAFSLSHLECVVAVTARAFGETRCSQQKPKLDSYLALPSSRLGFKNASSCTQSDSTRNVWMWGSPSCYSFGDLVRLWDQIWLQAGVGRSISICCVRVCRLPTVLAVVALLYRVLMKELRYGSFRLDLC